MEFAFIIASIIVVLFVCMSDFSSVNLDSSTEKLLYVSDEDEIGYEFENNQTVENNQQSDFSDLGSLDNDFSQIDFDDNDSFDNDAMMCAEDLINQVYGG